MIHSNINTTPVKVAGAGREPMGIGEAVKNLLDGRRVARTGWNGWSKGMYLLYANGGTFKIEDQVMGDVIHHIIMRTADDKFVPWTCSQTDLLAKDWEIVK
jgi:hypothetical protein